MSKGNPWDRSRAVRSTVHITTETKSESENSLRDVSFSGREAEAWGRLSPPAQEVLRMLLSRWGVLPAVEDRLLEETVNSCWSGLEIRFGLHELQTLGVVETRKRFWGERVVAVPSHTYFGWMRAAHPWEQAGADCPCEETLRGGGRLLSRVLLGALALLARSGLKLTVKGMLHRKVAMELERAVSLPLNGLSALWLTPAWRLDYPPAAALTLDWAFSLGLLQVENRAWHWNLGRLETWLREPMLAREKDLLRWFVRRALLHSSYTAAVVSVTLDLEEEVWYSAARLQRAADARGGTSAGGGSLHVGMDSESQLLDWLELLADCGWAELGTDSSGETCFRLLLSLREVQDDEAGEDPLMLQPDGTIWAGSWTAYRILWPLELAAERGEIQEMTAYRLTEKSIQGAAALGLERSRLGSWLGCVSRMRLPHLIEELLESEGTLQAGGADGEIFLLQEESEATDDSGVSAVQVDDAERSVHASKSLLSDSAREPADPEAVFKSLEPAPPLSLYASGARLQPDKIPGAWTTSPRSYHASTSRQLLECAAELQVPVELHDSAEHEAKVFIPLQIRGEGLVEGFFRGSSRTRHPATLSLEGLGRMRLLLPRAAVHR